MGKKEGSMKRMMIISMVVVGLSVLHVSVYGGGWQSSSAREANVADADLAAATVFVPVIEAHPDVFGLALASIRRGSVA
ncbi:MAG: hypothetical protein LBT18_04640 [Endomicrobium sp.]|jgi:hypothetical protein|nr:hypothetical protein [Endomicrobium sp.]